MTKTLKLQVLITARALIADKKHWTQLAYARNKRGKQVTPIDDECGPLLCSGRDRARPYRVCTGKYDWDNIPCISDRTLDRLEKISEERGTLGRPSSL
jgi:hypothetical protein